MREDAVSRLRRATDEEDASALDGLDFAMMRKKKPRLWAVSTAMTMKKKPQNFDFDLYRGPRSGDI
jgi:hypothetical protein